MTTPADFWDNAAEKYSKSKISDLDGYHTTLERTRTYLAESDHVLEIGCGTGSTALLLAPNVSHITASDISPNMVSIGSKKAQDQGIKNVSFVASDIYGAKIEEMTYDAVLALNVLHLLEDVPSSVRRVHELLRPGGIFISKTFAEKEEGLNFKMRMIKLLVRPMQWFGKAPFVNFMNSSQLENAMTSNGFEILESGYYPAKADARYIVAKKR